LENKEYFRAVLKEAGKRGAEELSSEKRRKRNTNTYDQQQRKGKKDLG